MRWWVTLRFWLRARLRAHAVRREIEEEIGYHVERAADELRAQGMNARAARSAALERFGDIDHVRRRLREEYMVDRGRGGELVSETIRDVGRVLRGIVRAPGFTGAVVLTLALGIGANSAIFTVLNGVLLRPLPYDDPSQLVRLWQADRVNQTLFENFSAPDYFDVVERNGVFSSEAVMELRAVTLTDAEGDPARLIGVATSEGLPDVLGLPPTVGRWFSAAEVAPDGPSVVVLGHALWASRYAADPSVVGRTIMLEGVSHEIIGVADARLELPRSDIPLWLPLGVGPGTRSRGQHNFSVVARIAEGVTLERANEELATIAAALEETEAENEGRGMWAQPLHESIVGDVSTVLYVLWGVVGLVLLIACVNVANLLLARANVRERDLAIHLALGSGRARLVRRLLTEYVALGAVGGLAGLVLAVAGVRALRAMSPESLPRIGAVAIDGTVLGFTLIVSLGAGLLCGLAPALQGTRADVQRFLSEGARGSTGSRRGRRIRDALVVVEIAMTVVVASSAGLLLRSLARLDGVDPGFDPSGVVTAELQLTSRYVDSEAGWPNVPGVLRFQSELTERLRSVPGVTHAGMALVPPTDAGWTTGFSIDGVATAPIDPTAEIRIRVITSTYPETVGMQLVRGRLPDVRDDLFESEPVALINEAMATRYFPDSDPLGATVSNWGVTREVIGVVRDERFMGLAQPAEPAVYPTFARMPFGAFSILVRSDGDPAGLAGSLRGVVAELDPQLAIGPVESLQDLLRETTGRTRFTGWLLTVFALAALLLASLGIYAVVSYGVAQRTHEIGVRISLGADRSAVAWSVVADVLRLAAVGIALGLVGVTATAGLLSALLFGVDAFDPVNLAVVVALCLGVAVVAAFVPARRASRVNAVVAVNA